MHFQMSVCVEPPGRLEKVVRWDSAGKPEIGFGMMVVLLETRMVLCS